MCAGFNRQALMISELRRCRIGIIDTGLWDGLKKTVVNRRLMAEYALRLSAIDLRGWM